jgi:hypothetical protein
VNLNQNKRCPIAGDLKCEDCRHYTAVPRTTVTDTGKEVEKVMYVCPAVESMLLLEQVIRQTYGTARAVEGFRNEATKSFQDMGSAFLGLAEHQERLAAAQQRHRLRVIGGEDE